MDVRALEKLAAAQARRLNGLFGGLYLILHIHRGDYNRNISPFQAQTCLSLSGAILRILAGMGLVTRDQVVAFLHAAMEGLQVSSSTLADRAGVSRSTINKFLANPGKGDLSMRTLSKISAISGLPFPHVTPTVKVPVLKSGQPRGSVDLQSTIPVQGGSQRDLPVYGEDQIGQMGYSFGDPEPLGFVERPADLLNNDRAYAIRIKDDSMAPRFKAGELIYVDPTRPARAGDEVVVRCKDGEGWVKRLVSRDLDGIKTDSYQPDGEQRFPNEELAGIHVIVGVAVSR